MQLHFLGARWRLITPTDHFWLVSGWGGWPQNTSKPAEGAMDQAGLVLGTALCIMLSL